MGWLLDHPDIHVTELSDADTVSDEYSDEEVLEELEEAEPTFSVVHYPLISAINPLNNTLSHLLLSLPNCPYDMINNSFV